MEITEGAEEWEGPRGIGGQAEDEVCGDGTRLPSGFGANIEPNLQAEPDETSDAAEANSFGSQPGGVTGGNARHFGQIVHGSEFHVAGAG